MTEEQDDQGQEQEQTQAPERDRTASLGLDWENPKIKLRKFDTVQNVVQQLEDLRMAPEPTSNRARGLDPDDDADNDVIDLRTLRFTAADSVQVPGFGILEMTTWAKRQLGTELGVRWDKFFGEQDPQRIQRAVNDHFLTRNNPIPKKIIARQHREDKASSRGLLRAFVGKNYEEIRDARLLDRMRQTIGPRQLSEMGFAKSVFNDIGTHLCLVHKEPLDIASTGKGGKMTGRGFHVPSDMAYFGLRLRNSEVGAYSLTGDGYLLRIICTNGMIDYIEGERWLYRQHRRIADENLDELIDGMFEQIPMQRERIRADSALLRSGKVENPEEEIRHFLSSQKQSVAVQEAAVKAYQKEPDPTYFGVLQAITRLGMAIRRRPDRQFEIERLAGVYLSRALSRLR